MSGQANPQMILPGADTQRLYGFLGNKAANCDEKFMQICSEKQFYTPPAYDMMDQMLVRHPIFKRKGTR